MENNIKLRETLANDPSKFIEVFSMIGRYSLGEAEKERLGEDQQAWSAINCISSILEASTELSGSINERMVYLFKLIRENTKDNHCYKEIDELLDEILKFVLVAKMYNSNTFQMTQAFEDIEKELF